MKHKQHRAGYAMLIVLAFIVFFFSLLAIGASQLSSLLRSQTVQQEMTSCDEGSTTAVARGLALLETGYPATSPYVCGVTLSTSSGNLPFTVTMTYLGSSKWTVNAHPTSVGEITTPIPAQFTSQTPP
ncbi:MAG TPA: hypothetical protein VMJ32_08730 [Pirellulales bacterium]|nr:hypothetical protein [Pirellulales bacterium]